MNILEDTSVKLESLASRKVIRQWVVSEVRYDFDYDGYCRISLGENEYCEFGSPFDAYNHAKHLVRKYRKKYSDAIIVIEEKGIGGLNV